MTVLLMCVYAVCRFGPAALAVGLVVWGMVRLLAWAIPEARKAPR